MGKGLKVESTEMVEAEEVGERLVFSLSKAMKYNAKCKQAYFPHFLSPLSMSYYMKMQLVVS